MSDTKREPLVSDEEALKCVGIDGAMTYDEQMAGVNKLIALVRKRLAERVRVCKYGHKDTHTCTLNVEEAARIVEED